MTLGVDVNVNVNIDFVGIGAKMEWFVWEIACHAVICDLCVEKCNFKRRELAIRDLISHCHQQTAHFDRFIKEAKDWCYYCCCSTHKMAIHLLKFANLFGVSINVKIMNNKSQEEHDFLWLLTRLLNKSKSHCLLNLHMHTYIYTYVFVCKYIHPFNGQLLSAYGYCVKLIEFSCD